MVGDTIYDAFWPDRLYNHDACDPDGMVELGKTRHGEVVETNKRAVDSDLVIYVNINLVPIDGGHKSVGVGHCGADIDLIEHRHADHRRRGQRDRQRQRHHVRPVR